MCDRIPAAEPKWQTGPKFRAAIEAPFAAAWKSIELRDVLQQVQQETGVAILLDRRIDPTAMPEIKFTGKPLRDGLADLAASVGAEISTPENVVYIGPAESCRKIRTLIALRMQDIKQPLSRTTIRWNDLDSPADILRAIFTKGRTEIQNLDAIDYDLWAAGVLPSVTAVEALSLILIQFDLTFRTDDSRRSTIELIPVPDDVHIEQEHTLPQKSAEQRLVEWRKQFPDLKFDRKGLKVKVAATIEQHEALRAAPAKIGPKPAGPLAKDVFKLEIKDISVRNLMADLEKSGVQFDYDADELKKAGVDLDQLIELNVKDLPAAKFFETIFAPLGVKSEIVGNKVKLAPK